MVVCMLMCQKSLGVDLDGGRSFLGRSLALVLGLSFHGITIL